MIAAWMLFAIEISALLFVAAWLSERALLLVRRPVRGVWVAAILGANVLPIVLAQLPGLPLANRWALPVATNSLFAKFGTPLLVLWGVAVAIGCFMCASAVWRMSRTRPLWKNEHVDDTPVLVSHDVGPALVGVMQYSIVVPQWAYSLEQGARRLLLAHEREHARQYDPLLLAAAALAVVLAPWNVFNWLFFRRLHLAVELDCDQRVLRVHPDAHRYSALLLDVAERVLPSVMPAAAFVEHGASLEKRLNAMHARKKSFGSLRAVAGISASVLLVSVACFTPRPYIIIVNPPVAQPGAAPVSIGPSVVVMEQKRLTDAVGLEGTKRMLDSAIAAKATFRPAELYAGPKEVWPVMPSARVKALDDAERARLRDVVLNESPNALRTWARADSALLLLFDAGGSLVKRTTVAKDRVTAGRDASYVFMMTFTIPEAAGIRATAEMQIERGPNGEMLQTPLTLYVGRLLPNAPVPLTRADIKPTREAMLAVLRTGHPELLSDTVESLNAGMLLYDSHGKLLQSAAISTDNGRVLADGTINNDYEKQAWKKAFGAVMDSGVVVMNGTYTLLSGKPLREGPSKILYAILVKTAELRAHLQMQARDTLTPAYTSFSAWRNGRHIDSESMKAGLRDLVDSRVPDAYGDWVRGDSAVMFLFDDHDELVSRKAVSIPTNTDLGALSNIISHRLVTLPADEIQAVGIETFTTSPAGRMLDKPLVVVWGMLYRDAKWQQKPQ